MELSEFKRFSYGTIFLLVVVLVLIIAGGMFLGDEMDDFFDHRDPTTTQPMELRGSWLGVKLVGLDSPTAQRLGIPPSTEGVMVVEIMEMNGWRARQAGIMEGDVVVGVDGKSIRNLADLYDVSRKVDVSGAVMLDVRRWGQPVTLVLPALHAPPQNIAQWQPGQVAPAAPGMTPGVNSAATQPVAWAPTTPNAQYYGPPTMNVAGAQTTAQGAQFYCAMHGQTWAQASVQPNYVCPLGGCQLTRTR